MCLEYMIAFSLHLFCAIGKFNGRSSTEDSIASLQNLEKFRQSVFVFFFLLVPLLKLVVESERLNSDSVTNIAVVFGLTILHTSYLTGFIENTLLLDKVCSALELTHKHAILSGQVDPDSTSISSVAVSCSLLNIICLLMNPNIFNSTVGSCIEFSTSCFQIYMCIVLSAFESVNQKNHMGCRDLQLSRKAFSTCQSGKLPIQRQ